MGRFDWRDEDQIISARLLTEISLLFFLIHLRLGRLSRSTCFNFLKSTYVQGQLADWVIKLDNKHGN